MKVVSLFSGCGGLDLGFKQAGFKFEWANEFDKSIIPTLKKNFPSLKIDQRNISDISGKEIPDCDGIIGGPPCQSWSAFGKQRGIDDKRGKLFYDYIRIIKEKRPAFFLAENVKGVMFKKQSQEVSKIMNAFTKLGYNVSYGLFNTIDYNVPQNRVRVIIVGYAESLGEFFYPPEPCAEKLNLKNAIFDLRKNPVPAIGKFKTNPKFKLLNHEYMTGDFSSHYMSRNRIKTWEEPSFTIQASGRHAPCHPDSGTMIKVEKDVCRFSDKKKVRRLSVRECARIQTFPDNFQFQYNNLNDGYKMIGNAVPPEFAKLFAKKIKSDFKKMNNLIISHKKKGSLLFIDPKNKQLNFSL